MPKGLLLGTSYVVGTPMGVVGCASTHDFVSRRDTIVIRIVAPENGDGASLALVVDIEICALKFVRAPFGFSGLRIDANTHLGVVSAEISDISYMQFAVTGHLLDFRRRFPVRIWCYQIGFKTVISADSL